MPGQKLAILTGSSKLPLMYKPRQSNKNMKTIVLQVKHVAIPT